MPMGFTNLQLAIGIEDIAHFISGQQFLEKLIRVFRAGLSCRLGLG